MRLGQFAGSWRVAAVGSVAAALLGLVGCAAERPKLIPDSAVLKAQGNDRVVYVAEDAGNFWIADKDAQAIVYSGRLNPGDRLVVDTHENVVTVNDRAVVTRALTRRDYKVFFEPGLAVPAAARVSPADARADFARPLAVPAIAALVGEGRDRIEYTAADDGEVWVADADRNTLVYSGRVVRGEKVLIDPKEQRLAVGGRMVLADRAALPPDNYRIFFARSADMPRGAVLTPTPTPSVAVVAVPPPVVIVDRPAVVPASAVVWSEFKDRTEVIAIDPGNAWVVDGSNRVVYSTRLQKGDVLTVDPAGQQIIVNGRRANDGGTLAAGRYRVFFEKAPQ